jgi:hypothetical protein
MAHAYGRDDEMQLQCLKCIAHLLKNNGKNIKLLLPPTTIPFQK